MGLARCKDARARPLLLRALGRRNEASTVRELAGVLGIELRQKVVPYLRALQERKVIALNAGMTVIRLLPPLVIT